MAVGWFKLRVNVLLTVNLINKRMESVAVCSVFIDEVHRHRVDATLECIALRKIYRAIFEAAATVSLTNFDTVNLKIFDMPSIKVQEKRFIILGHFLKFESNHDLTKESFTLWNGHEYFIADILDQLLSVLGLNLGQFVYLTFWQLFWDAGKHFFLFRTIKNLS